MHPGPIRPVRLNTPEIIILGYIGMKGIHITSQLWESKSLNPKNPPACLLPRVSGNSLFCCEENNIFLFSISCVTSLNDINTLKFVKIRGNPTPSNVNAKYSCEVILEEGRIPYDKSGFQNRS